MDRRRTINTWALVALLMLGTGCGTGESAERDGSTAPTRAVNQLDRETVRIAKARFAVSCQRCHTLLGKRRTGVVADPEVQVGPNLDHIRTSREHIMTLVELGGFEMNAFAGVINPKERRALAAYVNAVSGRKVRDVGPPPPDGEEIFAEHCASCHAIAGKPPTEEPLWVGIDFNVVKPSAPYVERIVTEGWLEERMPSFRDKLSPKEIRDVAAYVSAVATEG